MVLFSLPSSTAVNKNVPKNAFDSYASSSQKTLFTNLISKITWSSKLSEDTINLPGQEIKEVQIFRVDLKQNGDAKSLLDVIDKAIPYHIIFVVSLENSAFISTSKKHPHPTNENNSVLDWTFRSPWFSTELNPFSLNLRKSIDAIYLDFCNQLSGNTKSNRKSFDELIELNSKAEKLKREIANLKSAISKCKQFNQKVELNIKLKEAEKELMLTTNKN